MTDARTASSRVSRRSLACVALLGFAAGCAHILTKKQQEECEVHNDLGVQAFQNGRYQEAMREFETALEFNPDMAYAHGGLGLVYLYYWTGARVEDAKKEFQKAVQLDKHYADAWNNLGSIYAQQGDIPQAQDAFEHALSEPFYKTPWIAQVNLGWVLHLQGQTEPGLQMVRQALIEDPSFCMAHRTLVRILTDKGLTTKADTEWQAFAKACPKDPDAAFHEATLLTKKGDFEGAVTWLRACIDAAGTQPVGDDCRRSLATLPPEIAAAPIAGAPVPAERLRQSETIDLPPGAQPTVQSTAPVGAPAPAAPAELAPPAPPSTDFKTVPVEKPQEGP
jgi:type IV pilus biogenesis/stability protein PilW